MRMATRNTGIERKRAVEEAIFATLILVSAGAGIMYLFMGASW